MLSGNPIVSKSSPKESKTASLMKPQSSRTLTSSLSPVQLKNTAAIARYLRQAFPVNHSALQERKKLKKTKETSGRKRSNVFAMFDPDTQCWKTSQVSLILDTSAKSSLRWPKQGTMQDGLCWEQTIVAHGTEERDSGYWLTPSTVQINPSADRRKKRTAYRESVGRHDIPGCLTEQVMTPKFWPTPRVSDTEGGIVKNVEMKDGSFSRVNKDGVRWGVKLKDAVDHAEKMWPTPRAQDSKHGAATEWELNTDHAGTRDSLRVQVVKRSGMWPTPRASSVMGEGMETLRNRGRDRGNLEEKIAMWPIEEKEKASGGQLNSTWVSWLMGWPIGWVDLEPMKEIEFLPFDPEPNIPRVTTGEKDRAKKLKALGNGQVPQCAALAWKILNDSI